MMMANDFVPSTFLSHSIIVIVLTYFILYHRRMCICISLHERNFKLFYSLFLCFVIWFRCSRNKQEKKRMCVIFPTSLKYMKIEGWFVIASWACGWLYLQNFGYYPVFRFWFYFGFVNCWTIEEEKKTRTKFVDWILSKIDAISKRIENWKGEQSWVSKLNTDKIERTLEWNVRKRVNNFVKVIITCAMKQINRLFPLPWVQHPNSNISLQHFGFYSNFISRSILTDNIFCRCFTFRVDLCTTETVIGQKVFRVDLYQMQHTYTSGYVAIE